MSTLIRWPLAPITKTSIFSYHGRLSYTLARSSPYQGRSDLALHHSLYLALCCRFWHTLSTCQRSGCTLYLRSLVCYYQDSWHQTPSHFVIPPTSKWAGRAPTLPTQKCHHSSHEGTRLGWWVPLGSVGNWCSTQRWSAMLLCGISLWWSNFCSWRLSPFSLWQLSLRNIFVKAAKPYSTVDSHTHVSPYWATSLRAERISQMSICLRSKRSTETTTSSTVWGPLQSETNCIKNIFNWYWRSGRDCAHWSIETGTYRLFCSRSNCYCQSAEADLHANIDFVILNYTNFCFFLWYCILLFRMCAFGGELCGKRHDACHVVRLLQNVHLAVTSHSHCPWMSTLVARELFYKNKFCNLMCDRCCFKLAIASWALHNCNYITTA